MMATTTTATAMTTTRTATKTATTATTTKQRRLAPARPTAVATVLRQTGLDGDVDAALATGRGCDPEVRRRQIAGVGMLLLAAIAAATLRAGLVQGRDHRGLVDPALLRSASLALAIGFLAYALEQEHRLRRLEARLAVRHDAELVVADRLLGAVLTHETSQHLHASLLVSDVVAAILAEVARVADVDSVEVRLRGLDGRMRVAGRHGEPFPPDGPPVVVALHARGHRLGELAVDASVSEGDRAVLDALARDAAAALANARCYEDAVASLGTLRDELHETAAGPVIDVR